LRKNNPYLVILKIKLLNNSKDYRRKLHVSAAALVNEAKHC
jgi:hypothetical protein